jgi:hypothetical protein
MAIMAANGSERWTACGMGDFQWMNSPDANDEVTKRQSNFSQLVPAVIPTCHRMSRCQLFMTP